MKSIAIIASFRNESECLEEFINRVNQISKKFKKINYKIIFINDFSNDNSEEIIKKNMTANTNILLINTKKNYGGSHSIHYGFNFVPKNYFATVIDCDMQDPLELIFETLDYADPKVLYHFKRIERNEGIFQNIYTKIAYVLLSIISLKKIVHNSNYFKIIPPYIVEKIQSSSEIYPYWNYFITNFARKNHVIEYKRFERKLGTSKFGLFTTNPWATFYSALANFFLNSLLFFSLLIFVTHFIFYESKILFYILVTPQVVNFIIFICFYIIKSIKNKINVEAEIIDKV